MNRNDMRCRTQRPYPVNECLDNPMDFYTHVDKLPLAMAFVAIQKYTTLFEPCKALQMGTAFPDLCKPFYGKRGVCK